MAEEKNSLSWRRRRKDVVCNLLGLLGDQEGVRFLLLVSCSLPVTIWWVKKSTALYTTKIGSYLSVYDLAAKNKFSFLGALLWSQNWSGLYRRGRVIFSWKWWYYKVKCLISWETTPDWSMEAGDEFLVSDACVSLLILASAKSD